MQQQNTKWLILLAAIFGLLSITLFIAIIRRDALQNNLFVKGSDNANTEQVAPSHADSKPASLHKDPMATGQLIAALQYNGSTESIENILAQGAEVNANDKEGWHPLQLAAKRGDWGIVKLLLDNGAEVNATNNSGVTALASAAYRGYLDIVRLLVDRGADINIKDDSEITAFSCAAKSGQTNVVEFLLEKGANIEETNWAGDTVLITAADDGRIELMRYLLARGANVNVENMMGNSALDEAKRLRNLAIIQMLQEAGAEKSSSTKRNEELTKGLQDLEQSVEAMSNSFQSFQRNETN